jgi:hypothetical protein
MGSSARRPGADLRGRSSHLARPKGRSGEGPWEPCGPAQVESA